MMPARELNSLADVILAAMQAGRQTAMGIAVALANAGRVVPEGGAAELSRLQALMNAQPADLTPEQVEALETAGNRVVNDHHHDDQCACDTWPEKCLSSSAYIDGTWDLWSLPLALPAIVGLWEVLRAADDAAELAALRIRNAELEALVLAAGAAAEQRHQLLDPSEPALGCFMTGPICALALADALAAHPEPCRFPSGPDCTCLPLAVTA